LIISQNAIHIIDIMTIMPSGGQAPESDIDHFLTGLSDAVSALGELAKSTPKRKAPAESAKSRAAPKGKKTKKEKA